MRSYAVVREEFSSFLKAFCQYETNKKGIHHLKVNATWIDSYMREIGISSTSASWWNRESVVTFHECRTVFRPHLGIPFTAESGESPSLQTVKEGRIHNSINSFFVPKQLAIFRQWVEKIFFYFSKAPAQCERIQSKKSKNSSSKKVLKWVFLLF